VRICRKPPNRWGKYTYTNIHLTLTIQDNSSEEDIENLQKKLGGCFETEPKFVRGACLGLMAY
jgi:hypothetical protein